jgi:Zn-dependent peptidase ImmA (M78 family)
LNTPESNLARRLVEKYSLRPPIDIDGLTRKYARVEVTGLPLDLDLPVDGVTFDLKASGKQPTIVLNKNRPLARRRFTLAHELGHVLIPWHIGLIVDEIDLTPDAKHTPYWVLESEANRFASELLMPTDWMLEVIEKIESPPEALEKVVTSGGVSRNAAVIRLTDSMAAGYIYALLDSDGVVVSSGRSPGTLANKPERGTLVDLHTAFPERWAVGIKPG